jgi:hypothetical protein
MNWVAVWPLTNSAVNSTADLGVPHISLVFREMWETKDIHVHLSEGQEKVKVRGLPHLAKNERDAPDFLHAALDTTACAPFFKERRMKSAEPTKLLRKSGMWGTPRFPEGKKSAEA